MSEQGPMRVAIAHGKVEADAPEDERDVLVEVESVAEALIALGVEPVAVPVCFEFGEAIAAVEAVAPAMVFNLVESLNGCGRYLHMAAELFEYLRIPFTGAPSRSLYMTTDKVLAKIVMNHHGIPTPPWLASCDGTELPSELTFPVIVKPIAEDASVGIDDRAVLGSRSELLERMGGMAAERRRGDFVESYVEGRELNVSLLEGEKGSVTVLPPAEIEFRAYPPGKPKIVGYEAKWERDSFAYSHTPRTFGFGGEDGPMLDRVKALALRCWDVMGLRGYGRVDFRIDAEGNPWVIEVNANPCISPDSGFVAAAFQAGFPSYESIIRAIVSPVVNLD